MKDIEDFIDTVIDDFYEDPFFSVDVTLERLGTRNVIEKRVLIQIDRRTVSQLEDGLYPDDDWEFLDFLVNSTKKWEIVDYHYR